MKCSGKGVVLTTQNEIKTGKDGGKYHLCKVKVTECSQQSLEGRILPAIRMLKYPNGNSQERVLENDVKNLDIKLRIEEGIVKSSVFVTDFYLNSDLQDLAELILKAGN